MIPKSKQTLLNRTEINLPLKKSPVDPKLYHNNDLCLKTVP